MNLLEAIILTLVIGFVVLILSYTVITKIFEENRKNVKEAQQILSEFLKQMPDMMTEVVKKFSEIGK